MSSTSIKDGFPPELLFRSINGSKLKFIDRSAKAKNVMKFILYKSTSLNDDVTICSLLATLVLWKVFDVLLPFVASVLVLVLQFINFITSVHKDTLIAVESVGIYTEGRRTFGGLSSCQFIPWDTVEDIFINEVIKGQKVLYYLTIIVKESVGGKDSIKLIPLFQELIPERKCLEYIYERLSGLIGSTGYHRTTRNFEDFIYGRELMKIIRRIIKNQPGQGQQFGTSHLLVTYNYTSWTRQDKAFALLKFRERSVTAFSHAFILTIKIMHSVESSEQIMQQFRFSDKSVVNTNGKESEKENLRLQNTSRSNFSERSNEYNIQDKALEAENKSIQLDCNLRKTSTNEHSARDAPNYSDVNKVTKTSNVWSEVSVMQYVSSESKTKFNNKAKENRSHNSNNKDSTLFNSVVYIEENETISNRSNISIIDSINNNDKLFEANHYVIENDFAGSGTNKSESVTKKLPSDNNVDSTNIDSINLPYQYLMEKEVEDAKRTLNNHEIKNVAPSYSNSRKHKLEEANENYSANPVELFTDTVKAKDVPSPKRKKLAPDLPSRSSDITNLVMEGLMFTIRQEQDTVSVIEQKTKVEVDEVLENSEKIETIKGEKCLRNSSLLGLENLITLIELPSQTEAKRRCESTIVQENVSESQSRHKLLLPSNSEIRQQKVERRLKYKQWQHAFAANTSFANSNKNQEIHEKHKYNKRTKIKKNKYPKYEEEEEEDIVPEALQDEMFQSSVSSFQERNTPNNDLKVMVNKDLLMDDIDDTELSKTSNYESPNRSKVPIIVSNQIITPDQIPLPLQKIIKNQLQAANVVRVDEGNDTISQRQLRDENVENRNLRSRVVKHTSKNDAVQNNHDLENSKALIPSISNICDESTLSVTSDVKLETDNATDCSVNLNKEEPQAQSVTNKEEQSLFNPVQDVTEQLYRELSYMQRKKNGIDLKCLRSRRSMKGADDEVRLEMVKFFNDITRGAKVVVRRMSSKSIHRILGKSSALSRCMQY